MPCGLYIHQSLMRSSLIAETSGKYLRHFGNQAHIVFMYLMCKIVNFGVENIH